MSPNLPDSVDAWRAVEAGRIYEGEVALAKFPRLRPSLVDDLGRCRFRLEFRRDAFGLALVEVRASTRLPLLCQRELERFELPVEVEQTLGLIRDEREEAALPPGVEPVLLAGDGMLHPLDLVEDELILALPAMPTRPGSVPVEFDIGDASPDEGTQVPASNPFAALAALKTKPH